MTAPPRRLFVSRYREGLVFAPGAALYIAPLLILPGLLLLRNVWAAVVFGLVGLAIGTIFYTMRRLRDPALILAPEGMRLEGMPLQPWSQIEGIRPVVDHKDRPAIEIRLRRGAPMRPQTPLWRPTGRHTIVLHASLLSDPAPEIEDAFEYFLSSRVR